MEGCFYLILLPSGSELISIAGWESLKSIKRKNALKIWYSRVVKIRNTSEAVLRPQYTPWPSDGPWPYGPSSV